jgi:hypothetical protein
MNKIVPITYKEVFDKIWETFMVNRQEICMNSDGTGCVYRKQQNGTDIHCIVGCLLPNELLSAIEERNLNANGVVTIVAEIPMVCYFLLGNGVPLKLYSDLQSIHDHSCTGEELRRNLRVKLPRLAKEYDVAWWPPVEETSRDISQPE